jgi:hypothetical protein
VRRLADRPRAISLYHVLIVRCNSGQHYLVDDCRQLLFSLRHAPLAPPPYGVVACSKCEWKAAFSRAELLAMYGAECPLPTLLNHLAMPGCSKINTHWDRCGVYYVNPIDGRVR